jgi:hypothetical protein
MDKKYVIELNENGSFCFYSKERNSWVSLPNATVYNQSDVDRISDRPMRGRFVELPSYNGNINVTINGYSFPSAQDVANAIVKALRAQGVTQ